jgi:hypothetical protein
MIKKLITIAILASFVSCATLPQAADVGITLTVSTALSLIPDSARRTAVANEVDVVATGIRTITGSPLPAELAQKILAFIPASIQAKFPEIGKIVQSIQNFTAKFGTSIKILQQIATDIEAGAAPYITKSS